MTAGATSASQVAGLTSAETCGQIGKAQAPVSSHLPALRRERIEFGRFPQSGILPLVVAIAAKKFLGKPGEIEKRTSRVAQDRNVHGLSPAIAGS